MGKIKARQKNNTFCIPTSQYWRKWDFFPFFFCSFFSISHLYPPNQKKKQKVKDKVSYLYQHPYPRQGKPPNSTILVNLFMLYTVKEYPNSCFNQLT